MRRFAVVLLGASLVLAVAISASASQRHGNATPVQKAQRCIRAALRQENLAIRYLTEGGVSEAAVATKVIGNALEDLKCAVNATRAAGALDEISVAESRDVRDVLDDARGLDTRVKNREERTYYSIEYLKRANVLKEQALADLKKATAPPPAPPPPPVSATFTIALGHIFGAGPSSTNDCETVTVNETGINVTPTGTLNLTGPGAYNTTNPLTFTQSGTGVYVSPSTFLFTAFGTYAENAKITVGGTTTLQTGTFTLDASNDKTTAGCSPP